MYLSSLKKIVRQRFDFITPFIFWDICTRSSYVKCLFINIQNQENTLKSRPTLSVFLFMVNWLHPKFRKCCLNRFWKKLIIEIHTGINRDRQKYWWQQAENTRFFDLKKQIWDKQFKNGQVKFVEDSP